MTPRSAQNQHEKYSEVARRSSANRGWLDVADAAQLLWRIELAGGDVGERSVKKQKMEEP